MNRFAGLSGLIVVVLAGGILSCGLKDNGSTAITYIPERDETGRWTVESANEWYAAQPWLVGCNFIPSTAINQLEMWQAETFDPETIDRELGWAQDLGFNTVRVFLHDLLWETDQDALLARIEQYLEIADRHNIKTMFVLFDNVWGPVSELGPQPAPTPGVHNSGWVQSPQLDETLAFSTDLVLQARLEAYVKGIIEAFGNDNRVIMWDLVNEPGNSLIMDAAKPLVESAFKWAREVAPLQPLTVGTWQMQTFWEVSLYQIDQSDIVTFHSYDKAPELEDLISGLRELTGRPMICTEYMARTRDSLFKTHMPVFLENKIGAINWGLVSGKTQTIYSWTSKEGDPEPALWFHDIFRADGTPFDATETDFIKQIIEEANL